MTKIQIPISLSGDIVCTCGSPNSAGIAEENPLKDRAFSMSKQFHVTERSGADSHRCGFSAGFASGD